MPVVGRRLGYVVQAINYGQYLTQPLEEALKEALSEDRHLFGGTYQPETRNAHVKVAVTTTTNEGRVLVLSNYNRKPPEICKQDQLLFLQAQFLLQVLMQLPALYRFHRPEPDRELKLWEA
jgi:hypothetical protein